MLDCHSHILPNMDDGCKSIQEAMSILQKLKREGVEVIVATPHFYPNMEIKEFLERRAYTYQEIMKAVACEGKSIPCILKGAEVLLTEETENLPELAELCIEGTRYILIELPYTNWTEWVYTAIENIITYRGLTPIIAHIERYEEIVSDMNKYNRLLKMEVLAQINSYSLRGRKKKFCLRLIKNHMVHVLGSDVHRRKRRIGVCKGIKIVEKKLGDEYAWNLRECAKRIVENQKVEKLEYKPIRKILSMYR